MEKVSTGKTGQRDALIERYEDLWVEEYLYTLWKQTLHTIDWEEIDLENEDRIIYTIEENKVNFIIIKHLSIEEEVENAWTHIEARYDTIPWWKQIKKDKVVHNKIESKVYECSLPLDEFNEKILWERKMTSFKKIIREHKWKIWAVLAGTLSIWLGWSILLTKYPEIVEKILHSLSIK